MNAPANEMRLTDEEVPARGAGRTGRIVLLILAVAVYVAALIVSRTDGFRAYIAERMEQLLDTPVIIDQVSLDPFLRLHLDGLKTSPENSFTALDVEGIVLRWSLAGLFRRENRSLLTRVDIDQPRLAVMQNDAGVWRPAALTHVLRWIERVSGERFAPNLLQPDIAHIFVEALAGARITLRNGSMEWLAANGQKLAYATGIRVEITPTWVPDRALTHLFFAARDVVIADTLRAANVEWEDLAVGDRFLQLRFRADGMIAPEAGPPEKNAALFADAVRKAATTMRPETGL